MLARGTFVRLCVAGAAAVALTCRGQSTPTAVSSTSGIAPLVVEPIDDAVRVTIEGNTRPEAIAANDQGRLDDAYPLGHMLLLLQRSAEQERALEQLIADQQSPTSPRYHQWLTAQHFGDEFGLADADLAVVTSWLESHGFTVSAPYPGRTMLDFTGTAGLIREAFHTELHALLVDGEQHISNMSDPQIPAALAPAIAGIVSLNDFRPRTLYQPRSAYTFTSGTTTLEAVVPADLATIYDLNPLFSASISGAGQTIALIEDTNVYSTTDWTSFRNEFGLSSYTSATFTQVHPAPTTGTNNCTNPGDVAGNDGEASLDVEWASAAAPNATIELASCADTKTVFGGLFAVQNLVNGTAPPPIMSISYGLCEALNGATNNAAYSTAYQQAVAEGVSVFVSAGDSAGDTCSRALATNATHSTHGIGVNGYASTAYNVAVGGTDFGDTYAGTNSTYWTSANNTVYESAQSYIPEIPWNDTCASVLVATHLGLLPTYGSAGFCNTTTASSDDLLSIVGGAGGPSGCATGTAATQGVVGGSCAGRAKPSWQSLLGVPSDGVRDLPDLALFAADGLWLHYYVFCYSNPGKGLGGAACTGAPSAWSGAGGTSFASPIMAGMQALVNQRWGAQGNPAPVYYQMAATEYGATGSTSCNSTNGKNAGSSCVFYDVTLGDMDIPCTGTDNCYLPSGKYGVLSTSNSAYDPAFAAGTGWDFATGIGSVNAYNLVMQWPGTTSTVVATPAGAEVGTTVTLTATVTTLQASPTMNGTFTFYDGTTNLGSKPITPTTDGQGHVGGTATLSVSTFAVGVHNVSVKYGSDSHFTPSTSPTISVTIYSDITISPTTANVVTGQQVVFTGSGGSGSYNWAISTNRSGATVATCTHTASCSYVAGATGGVQDLVTVSDETYPTFSASATVTVNVNISVTPTTKTVVPGQSITFTAAGGLGTYSWSVVAHSGATVPAACQGSATCTYIVGPTGSGTDTLTVHDTNTPSDSASTTITVNAALAIAPTSKTVVPGQATTFTASGGVGSYTWSVVSTSGATVPATCQGSATCAYTVGGTSGGKDVLMVSDGNTPVDSASATITVNPALTIAPGSKTVVPGQATTFVAAGGIGAYTWTLKSLSGGTLPAGCQGSATCTYAAGGTSGVQDVITVSDANSPVDSASATLTVTAALTITSTAKTVVTGQATTFTAAGGIGAYTWTLTSRSGGTLPAACQGSAICVYAVGTTSGVQDILTVSDANSPIDSASATITINAALAISPTTKTLITGQSATFTATGGVGSYTWTLTTNHSGATLPASCQGATCPYTAGTGAQFALGDVLTVTDSNSPADSISAAISIHGPLYFTFPSTGTTVDPVNNSSWAVVPGESMPFTASGGIGQYTWALTSNSGGTLSAACQTNPTGPCMYTAGTTSGVQDVLTLSDGNSPADVVVLNLVVNAALTIAPSTKTVVPGQSVTFTATGGAGSWSGTLFAQTKPIYAWTLSSSSGEILPASCQGSATCTYVAGATSGGQDILAVSDNNYPVIDTASATITIAAALKIAPTTRTAVPGQLVTFAATGGIGAYAWSLTSLSGGTLPAACQGSATCSYTVGATIGVQDTLTVSDANSPVDTASAIIKVTPPIAITPVATAAVPGQTVTFKATGGIGSYSWSLASAAGAMLPAACQGSATCSYTIGATSGVQDVLSVSDTNTPLDTVTATITVKPPLAVAPTSRIAVPGQSVMFNATGGIGSYTWSLGSPSGGTLPAACQNSATCSYVIGVTGGVVDTLTLSDGNTPVDSVAASITVNQPLKVVPAAKTVVVGQAVTFMATGGIGSYSWSLSSPSGATLPATCQGSATCAYVAGSVSEVADTLTVSDGNAPVDSASATITVNAALAIAPSSSTVVPAQSVTFTATGGVGAYSWVLTSPSGAVLPAGCQGNSSCTYTAGSIGGVVDTLTLSDGNTPVDRASATITVNLPLAVAPASRTVVSGQSVTLQASGGVGAYSWSFTGPTGGVTPLGQGIGSVQFAQSAPGQYVVMVSDSNSPVDSATSIITVDPTLTIAPLSNTVVPGQATIFVAAGGVGAYSWSVVSQSGGVLPAACQGSATCTYVAGTTSGVADVITLSDSNSPVDHASATVTVTAPLSMMPAAQTVVPGQTVTLTASGGIGAYAWSVISQSGGTVSAACQGSATCAYVVGATPGTQDVVTVSDGNTPVDSTSATITINPFLNITPADELVVAGQITSFAATGGVGPYTWSVSSLSGGMFVSTSGATASYAAGTITGVPDLITVTDSNTPPASITAVVTVEPGLSITPQTAAVIVGQTVALTASGGVSGYIWRIAGTSGATIPESCQFTAMCGYTAGSVPAGASTATDTITLMDSDSPPNTVTATITVSLPLAISPSGRSVVSGQASTFTVTGGVGNLTWSIVSASGAVIPATCQDQTTCQVIAGTGVGSDVITVTDSDTPANTVSAPVTVSADLSLAPAMRAVESGDTVMLSAAGGLGAYTWSLSATSGGVLGACQGQATCAYVAGPIPGGTDTITVTDLDAPVNSAQAVMLVFADLALTPTSSTIDAGGTVTFTAAGGVGPFSWTVTSSSGGQLSGCATSQSCSYVAGGPGVDTVTVTDADEHSSPATVIVDALPQVSPVSSTVVIGASVMLSVTGGVAPYVWSINSESDGSIAPNGATCAYAAGLFANTTDTITVTDAVNQTSVATVTVNAALAVTPASATVLSNGSAAFTASGGVGAYTWILSTDASGAMLPASCQASAMCNYTAGATMQTEDVLSVTDESGNTADAIINVAPGFVITPSAPTVLVGGAIQFMVSGGSGSGYTWAFAPGDDHSMGTLTASGSYVAGDASSQDTIVVTDSAGLMSTVVVTVDPALSIFPANAVRYVGATVQFEGSGGVGAPYTWALASTATHPAGSITTAGLYTAGPTPGMDTIQLTDAAGNSTTTSLTIDLLPPIMDGGFGDAGSAADAGHMDDAGLENDAGIESDAGLENDAGAARDAGGDAGTVDSDGGSGLDRRADGGHEEHQAKAGCHCGSGGDTTMLFAALALLAGFARRRSSRFTNPS